MQPTCLLLHCVNRSDDAPLMFNPSIDARFRRSKLYAQPFLHHRGNLAIIFFHYRHGAMSRDAASDRLTTSAIPRRRAD
jgi:hypothetical protein